MRSTFSLAALATLVPFVLAQQVGTNTAETHPSMSYSECTSGGSCTSKAGKVVLDANWRWLHSTTGTTNCYDGNTWDATLCPDNVKCAANCALEGADYQKTYGITTSGNSLTLTFVTKHEYGTNVGSRVYLMESDTKYKIFKVLGQEFTFDVDVSALGCGLNGALYFSEMDADGGMAKYPTNKAGAKYGTGYCDAQCPRDMKFIAGKANVEGWTPSANDKNAGKGNAGTCCNEMDIWEANSMGAAFTPHPCSKDGLYRCEGTTECGDTAAGKRYDGVCDKDGCDFSHYRMGDKNYYGKGKVVDTTKPFTVVTQFITDNGSATGTLKEIRRLYVQNGKIIYNSQTNWPGLSGGPYDSITDQFCAAQKTLFGDQNEFKDLGGLAKMGASLNRGAVLVMSVWDDYEARMLWLDSAYPLDKDPATPGVARGECSRDSGNPPDVESQQATSTVKFSNIKVGPIGSTYTGTAPATTSRVVTSARSPSPVVTSPSPTNCRPRLQQCGGSAYTGAKCCVAGSTCTYVSSWYSQCR